MLFRSTTTEAGFVTRLSVDGSHILYSTFVGANFDSSVNALALDQQGNVFIAGGGQVQATPGAYQRPPSGCPPVFGFGFSTFTLSNDDAFILKLSPGSSAPLFLAAIGGACQDYINHIALDSAGNIWATGRTLSSDFPTVAPLPNLGSASSAAGFLVALDPSGSTLI